MKKQFGNYQKKEKQTKNSKTRKIRATNTEHTHLLADTERGKRTFWSDGQSEDMLDTKTEHEEKRKCTDILKTSTRLQPVTSVLF